MRENADGSVTVDEISYRVIYRSRIRRKAVEAVKSGAGAPALTLVKEIGELYAMETEASARVAQLQLSRFGRGAHRDLRLDRLGDEALLVRQLSLEIAAAHRRPAAVELPPTSR
jgi:hypothetical protein